MGRLFRHIVAFGLAMTASLGILPGGVDRVLAQTAAAAPEDGWKANEDDAWLFNLRSGKWTLGDGVRGYQTPTGVCLDLADMVMATDVAVRVDKKLRRATGWAFDERQTIEIDRDAGRAGVANRIMPLTPTTIRDTPEGWCVATDALASWFGIGLAVDLSNSIVQIKSATKLPFELQAERKARAATIRPVAKFDLATLPQVDRPYRNWQAPSVDVVYDTNVVRQKGRGIESQARLDLFASGEIGKASFDARLSTDNNVRPRSLHFRAYRSDPKGELMGVFKATHVAGGDVSLISTPVVAGNSLGRGFVITNRPLEQPDSFDRTSFRGELPSGWDAELYRNGQLLAFSTPSEDGRYAFVDVPLLYGMNRFEIILYGPQGQVRREARQIPVGINSIQPKKTTYWFGMAQENHDLIGLRSYRGIYQRGWRWTLGLEQGIDARTSMAGYLHSLMIENQRYNYEEVALRRAIGPALFEVSGSLADNGGYAMRGQVLAELGKTYLRIESLHGGHGYISDRLTRFINGIHTVSLDQAVTIGKNIIPVHAEASYITRTNGDRNLDVAGRASTAFRNLSLTGELRWRRTDSYGPEPPDEVIASLLANARWGKLRLRGEARKTLSGRANEDRLNLVGEWSGRGETDWRAELGYERAADRVRGGLGIVKRFNRMSATAMVEAASDGSVGAGLNFAFSFGPDPRGHGMRMSRDKLAAHGGAVALVYRDENADGVRQPSEPVETSVGLTAGTGIARDETGRDGMAIIEGLQPFRPIMIGIDAGSLPDPYVQPALPGKVIIPRPGVTTLVELPLVAAGEIDGKLVRAESGSELEGVDIELIDDAGRVRKTTRSEFDGFFLFEGVAYGRYKVRLAKMSADAARLEADLGVSATVSAQDPAVKLGVIGVRGGTTIAGVAPIVPAPPLSEAADMPSAEAKTPTVDFLESAATKK